MAHYLRRAHGVIAYHNTPTLDGRRIDRNSVHWKVPCPIVRRPVGRLDPAAEVIGMIERIDWKRGDNLIIAHGWVRGGRPWQLLRGGIDIMSPLSMVTDGAQTVQGGPLGAFTVYTHKSQRSAWADGCGLRLGRRIRP